MTDEMTKKAIIADELEQYRQNHNLSKRKLAQVLELNATSVLSYLSKMTYPNKETRAEIALKLGYTPGEFEAKLGEQPPVEPRQLDELKQDIRALPTADLIELFDVFCDRIKQDLQASQKLDG